MNCQSGVVVCGPLFVVMHHGRLIIIPCHVIFHPYLNSESDWVSGSVYFIDLSLSFQLGLPSHYLVFQYGRVSS